MIKNLILFLSVIAIVLSIACNETSNKSTDDQASKNTDSLTIMKEELQKWASKSFQPLPESAPNPNNQLTEAKIELGKKLYFETLLSKDQNISCNSCHDINNYGVDTLSVSPGDDGTLGTRNSPTVFNAALHMAQFWDGREPDVEAQAGGPILNPVEMQIASEEVVIERLKKHEEYPGLFKKAFEGDNEINFKNITKAIGAYERTLLTPAPFDDFINGDLDALTDKQIAGLKEFKDAACIACHAGSLLGGSMYQKFGTDKNYWEYTKSSVIDSGRYVVTGDEKDLFVFKVPSLRNVEMTFPYFHDGSVKELSKAVDIMAEVSLNKKLNDEQLENIEAFLASLTGEIKDEWK